MLNTLTLKPIFSKTKTFFKKLEDRFLDESTRIENATFPYNTAQSANPMLRQIEWGVRDGLITKNGVLPVTNLFFRKFCSSLRTSYKELI